MYQSLEAKWHDLFWHAEGPSAELPLLEDFFKNHPGSGLEVGCGSGRLLLPLIKNGLQIEGLELSQEMLTLCRSNAAEMNLTPILHAGDMENYHAEKPHAAIAVPAFTLQLTTDSAAAIANFHKNLLHGGGLYLTLFRPEAELANELPQNEWYLDHELTLPDASLAKVETRHSLERKKRLLHREHRYTHISPSGEILAQHLSQQTIRWFGDFELAKLLEKSKFKIENAFSEFDPTQPAEEAQIITIIASKMDS